MYHEGFHFVERTGDYGCDFDPYSDDIGNAPDDKELADNLATQIQD